MKQIMVIISLVVSFLSGCASDKAIEPGPNETSVTSEITVDTNNEAASDAEKKNEKSEENIMYIEIGNTILTAELADNSSANALKEMLAEGSITIEMSDYANFEKVGDLGKSLPRNDEQITTEAGDLILYQGNSFVIYYDTNSWNFTRLGKIKDVSADELRDILGDEDVTVTLSLEK